MFVALVALLAVVPAASARADGPPGANLEKLCGSFLRPPAGPARAVPGTTPAAQVAAYGVLRHPASTADVPSFAPGGSLGQVVNTLASYDPGEVRLVARLPGGSLYIVPGVARSLQLSAACRRALPTDVALFFAGELDRVGRGAAFCLVEISRGSERGTSLDICSSFAQIATGFGLEPTMIPRLASWGSCPTE